MSEKYALVERIRAASLRKDYDDFLDCLTEDIEYHYHVGSRPLLGKDWVRKFINRYEEIAADVVWRIDRYAESDNCLFLEGYEEYTDQRTGDRIAHPYMGIFEFRDGKVSKWRDYFEMDQKKDEAAEAAS